MHRGGSKGYSVLLAFQMVVIANEMNRALRHLCAHIG